MWGFMELKTVTKQEIEEGCKILAVNFRKEVEAEFKQLMFNEFVLKHKWPQGLFKTTCIKIIEVEEFFPVAQKILYWGGKIQRHYEMSKPLKATTGETFYLTDLPKLIGGTQDLGGEDIDEVTREGTKKVHPKIHSFFQELEAFKAQRRAEELGKRDRSTDPEMKALEEYGKRLEEGVALQKAQKAQHSPFS